MSKTVVGTEKLTRRLMGEVPVTLIEDVTIEINSGEFVAIAGPSGSGKSSLLYLLGLLDRPSSGKLWLHGIDTTTLNEDELADHRLSQIGFIFQFHFLLPEFSALENVMLPMKRLRKLSEGAIKARAEELLRVFGLGDHIHKVPKQLSGGQSQRVAIARALANEPVLILADEPTGNLDTASSANVAKVLKDLARKEDRAVVVVTHDQDFAKTADRIITVVDGQVVGFKRSE